MVTYTVSPPTKSLGNSYEVTSPKVSLITVPLGCIVISNLYPLANNTSSQVKLVFTGTSVAAFSGKISCVHSGIGQSKTSPTIVQP